MYLQILLVVFIVAAAWGQIEYVTQYDVAWTSVSVDSRGSMPIGNGDVALNVWVQSDGIYAYIAKSDAYDENSRLVKIGKLKISVDPNPFGGSDFLQTTKLSTGSLYIEAGGIGTEIWVDANNPVIYIDVFSVGSSNVFSYSVESIIWRNTLRTLSGEEASGAHGVCFAPVETPDIVWTQNVSSQVVWFHRNTNQPTAWAESIAMQRNGNFSGTDPLLNNAFGGYMSATNSKKLNDTLLYGQGSSVYNISVLIRTEHSSPSEQEFVDAISAIAQYFYFGDATFREKAKQQHEQWWSDFWSQSFVIMNSSSQAFQVAQYYNLQRWMEACGGGRGIFPIKFNGLLFTTDHYDSNNNFQYNADYRAWGGGYWFQNTRFPYWSMLARGDWEMMLPLFNMYLNMLPLVEARTQGWFGHDGGFFSETIWPWGTYEDGDYGCEMNKHPVWQIDNQWQRYHINGGLELLAMMLTLHDYIPADSFVQQYIVPIAMSEMTFFDEHYATDLTGAKVLTPAQSIETWQEAINPLPDVAGLWFVLPKLLALPNISAQAQQLWGNLYKQLPPIPTATNSSGSTYLSPAEAYTPRPFNSENAELYAVWPFQLYTLTGNNSIDVALNAFYRRMFPCNVGWCQDILDAALLGLAEEAAEMLQQRLNDPLGQGYRFPTFYNQHFDYTPELDHGAVTHLATQYMLMQTNGNEIALFPAWPNGLDVHFKFFAPSQTTVEVSCVGGKIVLFNVVPDSRKANVKIMGSACSL